MVRGCGWPTRRIVIIITGSPWISRCASLSRPGILRSLFLNMIGFGYYRRDVLVILANCEEMGLDLGLIIF
jgi:hypothetical protein